jgi:hypothetical protein
MDVNVLWLEVLVHRALTVQRSDGSDDVYGELEEALHADGSNRFGNGKNLSGELGRS